jgi:hypothetical protein
MIDMALILLQVFVYLAIESDVVMKLIYQLGAHCVDCLYLSLQNEVH